ncbi:maleylpyruvate isomerase N-terminal domain-containing protein [Mycobacterium colombiense]|uniref:maleylpyruvate isomerase N-terminal domain-containing protein n=1 Tax=Mycobacterium colombiense TaxID=339268 RepID=UPI000801CB79|nr:maleylpyruvate isomerase N-terminal domain-containing protein [Mycobacterium colombiense]OBJ63672.1 hypothetical protein A5627_08040 [Mycobacterium colombiense]
MTPTLSLRDEAMRAFVSSLSRLHPTAPTWCPDWSVHDLTAHVTAAAQERADLIDEHLAGKPTRATRSWEVREPPFRAMADELLRECLLEHAVRFESKVAALGDGDTIVYTGWTMTADRLRMHSHSEAALHRWDLVGDDATSIRLLADPAMVTHAIAAFGALPAMTESRRWCDGNVLSRPLVLRCAGRPDVVVTPGGSARPAGDGDGVLIELERHELPLVLWGRLPSRLRDANVGAQTLDDLLRHLVVNA